MKFSDALWEHINPIYQNIIDHPFNIELADGTLARRRFIFYIEQDAHYLIGFSRALALIAGRANDSKMIRLFLDFSLGALVAERELHQRFLGHCFDANPIEPSPACVGYVQYLIATAATASLEEGIAAVLPCFWIYRDVGRHIAASANDTNPYSLWINAYSSQEFSEGTDLAISILDEIAATSSIHTLARMKTAFEQCSVFEWHFWDDAYRLEVFNSAKLPIKIG
jgi:thiaminase/transcriptional activator TenA